MIVVIVIVIALVVVAEAMNETDIEVQLMREVEHVAEHPLFHRNENGMIEMNLEAGLTDQVRRKVKMIYKYLKFVKCVIHIKIRSIIQLSLLFIECSVANCNCKSVSTQC